jgi:formylglycine-generating enzyme required for sulfatase activity
MEAGGVFNPDHSVATGKNRIVEIVLPDAALSIPNGNWGTQPFLNFNNLILVSADNLLSIGSYAFSGCTSLESVSFPAAQNIGAYVFSGCTGLTFVSFPAATSIGNFAFRSCTNLTEASFPATTIINGNPFIGCANLTSFLLTGNGDLDVIENGRALVRNITGSMEIVSYPSATGTIVMNDIISIGDGAFAGCTNLTSIVIPNSIISIGDDAFLDTGLTTVFYGGADLAAWTAITIDPNNDIFTNATRYYYSATPPATANTHWRWVDEELAVWLNITSPTGIEMVWVPSGSFEMGGLDVHTSPPHQVTLTRGFYMGRYQITQEQWVTVMGSSNPSSFTAANGRPPAAGETDEMRPVDHVNWYGAIVFCNRLSMLEGLTPAYRINGSTNPVDWGTVPTSNNATWNAVEIDPDSNGYRLPTEAQWEYVARGGNGSPGNFIYSGSNDPEAVGWFYENSHIGHSFPAHSGRGTRSVGLKAPNGLGIYDMSGNVWEWCWDWGGGYTDDAKTDPAGPTDGTVRVFRGGSCLDIAQNISSFSRNFIGPYYWDAHIGFRVVRP